MQHRHCLRRTYGWANADFGTTERLRYNNMVMYDRQTESWWEQANGKAIVDKLLGEQLTMLPAAILSWNAFKQW